MARAESLGTLADDPDWFFLRSVMSTQVLLGSRLMGFGLMLYNSEANPERRPGPTMWAIIDR